MRGPVLLGYTHNRCTLHKSKYNNRCLPELLRDITVPDIYFPMKIGEGMPNCYDRKARRSATFSSYFSHVDVKDSGELLNGLLDSLN